MAEYGSPLDLDKLLATLDAEGINPNSYALSDRNGGECYVLATRPGGWKVYYSDRGAERTRMDYATEDEACRDLLARLQAQSDTHFHLVVGPLPPNVADEAFVRWKRDHHMENALGSDDVKIDNPVLDIGRVRRYWVRGSKLPPELRQRRV